MLLVFQRDFDIYVFRCAKLDRLRLSSTEANEVGRREHQFHQNE